MSTHVRNIDALSTQTRQYPPADRFAATANATAAIYDAGLDEFWAAEARHRLDWVTPFETVLTWERPYAKWFLGGKLNAAYNCVDRWVERGHGNRVAYHVVPDDGPAAAGCRHLTYAELQRQVVRFANGLRSLS